MPTINGKACVANGRNLLLDTKDINNLALWFGNETWTKQADKYNGLVVMQTTGDWNGLSQYVKVKTGEVYTFSVYARYASGTGASMMYWLLNANPEIGHASAQASATTKWVSLSDNWQRVSITTTITADGYIRPRIERTNNNSNILQIAGMKLETGTLATPLSPVPVDKVFSDGRQVYGRNLYTDTKNFDNLASWNVNGSWNPSGYWTKTKDTYKGLAVMQATVSWWGLSQYIQVKKGDVLTYSAYAKYVSGTGTSTIYWKLNGQTEGSYSAATSNLGWIIVTITESWQRISGTVVATSDGYLRPRLERTDNNTNTLQIAGIKLEKGSVATPWTPAPEDVM